MCFVELQRLKKRYPSPYHTNTAVAIYQSLADFLMDLRVTFANRTNCLKKNWLADNKLHAQFILSDTGSEGFRISSSFQNSSSDQKP